jgi:hypothetical protein
MHGNLKADQKALHGAGDERLDHLPLSLSVRRSLRASAMVSIGTGCKQKRQ